MVAASTITTEQRGPRRLVPPRDGRSRYLFVLLDCSRISDGSSRYLLDDIAAVEIGRGPERAMARAEEGGNALLMLPDSGASRVHARIQWREDAWLIEDLGSKNGTFVDGERVRGAALLPERARIEIGHTILTCRSSAVRGLADTPLRAGVWSDLGLCSVVPELIEQFDRLLAFAQTPGQVVLLGETGSGKDLMAHAYHRLTGRTGALVPVNCGALPTSLIEATLFGHKKGAFSGATTENIGLFRAAQGGTLFLDEIGDLPLAAQASLLRAIEAHEVLPIGSHSTVPVDVRVVAATHRDIPAMMGRGEFRADLWARLAGLVLRIPPLRERLEDMGLLVSSAVARFAPMRAGGVALSPELARELFARTWPLNVRELMAAINHALALAKGDLLGAEHLPDPVIPDLAPGFAVELAPAALPTGGDPTALRTEAAAPTVDALHPRLRIRRTKLELLLHEHEGNVSKVALEIGRPRPLVYRWLKKLGVDPKAYRPPRGPASTRPSDE